MPNFLEDLTRDWLLEEIGESKDPLAYITSIYEAARGIRDVLQREKIAKLCDEAAALGAETDSWEQ